MILTLKIMVGIVGVYLITIAGMWMLNPDAMSAQFAVTLVGIQGLSTGRSDLGGMFLAAGVLCLLGLRNHKSASFFLYAVAIIMAAVASGRLVGFALDGVEVKTIFPFLVELAFVVIMCGLAFFNGRRYQN